MNRFLLSLCFALFACSTLRPVEAPPPAPALSPALAALRDDERAARSVLKSKLALEFVGAVQELAPVAPRTVFRDPASKKVFTPEQASALPEAERTRLEKKELDEGFYYTTRYGTPVTYALAFERLADHGFSDFHGKRVVDYGFGYIGHLRMLAALGADATGVDVDPLLAALYSRPEDQGPYGKKGGRVRALSGRFPDEAPVTEAVGRGYHLFMSKNTLKRGYVHPSKAVKPALGLRSSDDAYLKAVFDLLEPGGYALVYNLYPAQKPEYIAWAEGETAFPRDAWERAGFEVLAFDVDDTAQVRAFGRALGWDKGDEPMDLERDLFGLYTVARKPVAPAQARRSP